MRGLPTLEWSPSEIKAWLAYFDKFCCDAVDWDPDYFRRHPYTNVYDFLRLRLTWNADRCSKKRAAFDFMVDPPAPAPRQSGKLVNAAIYSRGSSSKDSQTPLLDCEPGSKWWPVIIRQHSGHSGHIDSAVVPFYCPALAGNGGRPWWVHTSRVWLVPRAKM